MSCARLLIVILPLSLPSLGHAQDTPPPADDAATEAPAKAIPPPRVVHGNNFKVT